MNILKQKYQNVARIASLKLYQPKIYYLLHGDNVEIKDKEHS